MATAVRDFVAQPTVPGPEYLGKTADDLALASRMDLEVRHEEALLPYLESSPESAAYPSSPRKLIASS